MEATDPREAAARLAALYHRWAGAIPLDDLSPYQGWYQTLLLPDRRAFRRLVMVLLMGRLAGRDQPAVRRIVRAIDDWFPLNT